MKSHKNALLTWSPVSLAYGNICYNTRLTRLTCKTGAKSVL